MKDIPVFTTEYGAASLALREIPYRGDAYIRPLADEAPQALLDECIRFCRMCGATRIYACGQSAARHYPLHAVILQMQGVAHTAADPALLCPVTAQTVTQWRTLCNRLMEGVDHAATLTAADEAQLLAAGTYFVRDEQRLLGIGRIAHAQLHVLGAVVPGAGRRVLETLLSTAAGETVRLQVASTNRRALALYESVGFRCVGQQEHRYLVFGG